MITHPQGDITEFDQFNVTVDSKGFYEIDDIKEQPSDKDLERKLKIKFEPDVLKVTFEVQNENHETISIMRTWITNFSRIDKEAGITVRLGKRKKKGDLLI